MNVSSLRALVGLGVVASAIVGFGLVPLGYAGSKISRTKAFTHNLDLRAVCVRVVLESEICRDVDVFWGPEIDDALHETVRETEMASSFDYTEAGRRAAQARFKRFSPLLQEKLIRRLNEDAARALELFAAERGIFIRSDSTAWASYVAHEYGHLLFNAGRGRIRPEFLPAKTPVMTEEMVRRADEEERRGPTPLWMLNEKEPGSIKAASLPRDYFADPAEEFAYGFEVAAFRARCPEARLEHFLAERWGLDLPGDELPIPLSNIWFFEILWNKLPFYSVWTPAPGAGESVSDFETPGSHAER